MRCGTGRLCVRLPALHSEARPRRLLIVDEYLIVVSGPVVVALRPSILARAGVAPEGDPHVTACESPGEGGARDA